MLVLQQRMAEQSGVEVGGDEGGATQEASVWSGVDARMESVLEWGMGVADEWKELWRPRDASASSPRGGRNPNRKGAGSAR